MLKVVEDFESEARFEDEREAELIREKLEEHVTNILVQVEKRDKRFQSTLIHSGSVYEGVKVRQPDEFDFMIRIDSLTDKPSFHSCDKGEGYAKLVLEEQEWEEFKDDKLLFNPKLFSRYSFKKLVEESLSDAEVPEGLDIQRTHKDLVKESWWPVYYDVLGNKGGQENPSGVVYSETHGPATTLDIIWEGGDSYKNMKINVDLTPTLDCCISQLPVQLAELPQEMYAVLQKCGFHVVSAGFDSWRISFSMAEKEILVCTPHGFKACYRIQKVVRSRDDISEMLGLNPSLVPSYMLNSVLLSELIRTDHHLWEKEYKYWSQRITQVVELVLQGVKQEEIQNFFIPGHNLLTVSDHENKLRLCVVEDMLNQIKGQQLGYTPEVARERKQQVKVLQPIDLLEYFCLLGGKDPTAVWNMMFVNIGNVPGSPFYSRSGENWNQITDLNSTYIDEDTYWHLIAIWSKMEEFFKHLLATLRGEANLVAQKFKIFVDEKRRKFELEHEGLSSHKVEQISVHEFDADWYLDDIVNSYTQDDNSTLSSVHKVIPPGFKVSGFFRDAADVTMREGSERSVKKYLSIIPESYIKSAIVGYVSEIIVRSEDVMKSKLAHIKIPELDLD